MDGENDWRIGERVTLRSSNASSSEIGFVILSRSMPHQLKRLVERLLSLYVGSIIVCHHDFSQCPLDIDSFPPEVHFVTPHIATRWGHISLPLALMNALRLLYQIAKPAWFITLSESDYPIKTGEHVLSILNNGGFDAYIHYAKITYDSRWRNIRARMDEGLQLSYLHPDWRLLAYKRYISKTCRQNALKASLAEGHPVTINCHCGDGMDLQLFAGDQWMSGSIAAARVLLDSRNEQVLDYFADKRIPDEALYQTILCNKSELKICSENYRYADWSMGGAHPKILSTADFYDIKSSSAHFARKFQGNEDLLELIDREMLGL